MKKIMLAVAALVAVSSLSLVSCGSKNPADMAKAATEAFAKEAKDAKTPEDAAKALEKYQAALEDAYKACKNAEDSAAVEKAAYEAAANLMK